MAEFNFTEMGNAHPREYYFSSKNRLPKITFTLH